MKIKLTFRWTNYPDSKLATFLSKVKGSFAGFLGWCGLWLLPFMISAGIASNYGKALVAIIVVAACTLISYGLLFLIDESKIAAKKSSKLNAKRAKAEPSAKDKYLASATVSALRDAMCNYFLSVSEEFAQDFGKNFEFEDKKSLIFGCITDTIDTAIENNGPHFFDENNPTMLEKRNEVASKIFAITYYFLNGFDSVIELQTVPFEKRISALSDLLKEILNDTSGQFPHEDMLNAHLIDEIIKRK